MGEGEAMTPRVPAPVAAFAGIAYLLVTGGFLYACWQTVRIIGGLL